MVILFISSLREAFFIDKEVLPAMRRRNFKWSSSLNSFGYDEAQANTPSSSLLTISGTPIKDDGPSLN